MLNAKRLSHRTWSEMKFLRVKGTRGYDQVFNTDHIERVEPVELENGQWSLRRSRIFCIGNRDPYEVRSSFTDIAAFLGARPTDTCGD